MRVTTHTTSEFVRGRSTWTRNPIPACDGSISAGFEGIGCENGPTFPPPTGCNETCWGYQPCFPGEFPGGCDTPPGSDIKTKEMPAIVDAVVVPAHLPPGKYVVGFRCVHSRVVPYPHRAYTTPHAIRRWDCEHTPQIWSECGDVTVVAPSG